MVRRSGARGRGSEDSDSVASRGRMRARRGTSERRGALDPRQPRSPSTTIANISRRRGRSRRCSHNTPECDQRAATWRVRPHLWRAERRSDQQAPSTIDPLKPVERGRGLADSSRHVCPGVPPQVGATGHPRRGDGRRRPSAVLGADQERAGTGVRDHQEITTKAVWMVIAGVLAVARRRCRHRGDVVALVRVGRASAGCADARGHRDVTGPHEGMTVSLNCRPRPARPPSCSCCSIDSWEPENQNQEHVPGRTRLGFRKAVKFS